MKLKYLSGWAKAAWQNNKPFVLLLLSLLSILSFLKIIFYHYNYHFIFNNQEEGNAWIDKLRIIKWSLIYDLLLLLLINLPFLLLLQLTRFISVNISLYLVLPVFILLNSTVILL